MIQTRLRPTAEDYARGVGYLAVVVWVVLFWIFPPAPYVSDLDFYTRASWLALCALGAIAAALGSFLRIDLKMELPGIAFMWVGPLFYALAQVWYTFYPPAGSQPYARVALIAYALLPIFLTFPRALGLYSEIRRSSSLRKEMNRLDKLANGGSKR